MSSKCDGCGNTFLAGTKKIEYKGRQWHDTCFHCKVCSTKVGDFVSFWLFHQRILFQVGMKSFIIPNDKDIFCITCFEDKIATKCVKCKNVLTSGGVTFRGEPWHKVYCPISVQLSRLKSYFRSVSCVLAVKLSLQDRSLRAEMINPTVLTASVNCSPRDAQVVPNPSLVKEAQSRARFSYISQCLFFSDIFQVYFIRGETLAQRLFCLCPV